jgi:hypothetical protein
MGGALPTRCKSGLSGVEEVLTRRRSVDANRRGTNCTMPSSSICSGRRCRSRVETSHSSSALPRQFDTKSSPTAAAEAVSEPHFVTTSEQHTCACRRRRRRAARSRRRPEGGGAVRSGHSRASIVAVMLPDRQITEPCCSRSRRAGGLWRKSRRTEATPGEAASSIHARRVNDDR